MSKHCQTFQSPYSQPSKASIDHSVSHLPSSVSLWSNIRKHLLFTGSYHAQTLLSQKLLIPSPFYLKSITHYHKYHYITLSLNHSIINATVDAKKLANQKRKLLLLMKFLLLLLTQSPYTRNFLFVRLLYVFFFFVVAFWPIETTTTNLQGLTHSNTSKSTKPSHRK